MCRISQNQNRLYETGLATSSGSRPFTAKARQVTCHRGGFGFISSPAIFLLKVQEYAGVGTKYYVYGSKSISASTKRFLRKHGIDAIAFKGCGHFVMGEAQERFYRKLLKLIRY